MAPDPFWRAVAVLIGLVSIVSADTGLALVIVAAPIRLILWRWE